MKAKFMNIDEAIKKMEENPGLKMTMPNHYRSWEYNYYDKKSNKFLTETKEEWDINLSKSYDELEGYSEFTESN